MSVSETPEITVSAFRRAMILYFLTLAVALYAMTITIANVSLPQMQGALAATQDQIAWIVTFNIVATAVATPAMLPTPMVAASEIIKAPKWEMSPLPARSRAKVNRNA